MQASDRGHWLWRLTALTSCKQGARLARGTEAAGPHAGHQNQPMAERDSLGGDIAADSSTP